MRILRGLELWIQRKAPDVELQARKLVVEGQTVKGGLGEKEPEDSGEGGWGKGLEGAGQDNAGGEEHQEEALVATSLSSIASVHFKT